MVAREKAKEDATKRDKKNEIDMQFERRTQARGETRCGDKDGTNCLRYMAKGTHSN